MNPGFNSSNADSLCFRPNSYDIPSSAPSTFVKGYHFLPHGIPHHMLPCDENHQSPPGHKAHFIPVEIFSEIFLYTVQDDPHSQTNLMLVCRYWNDIMLSTPGIHSQLRIRSWTTKKAVDRFGSRWLLDVIVDLETYGSPLNPEFFFASFMTAAQTASRWRSLEFAAFPSPGEYKDLQILQPLQHLETFKLAQCCDLGNFLERLVTTITTTATPRLTSMEVLHPDAASYFFQPAHIQIFSSLTTLRLICTRRMQNPVDILPCFHKLEILEAHHLFLPIYSPSVDFHLIQTLRVLHLRAVSVQWMAGKIFPALEECSITSPHHADAIQSLYMPVCSILKYDSNNLGALEHFRHPPLARLEIKCGQWQTWSGNIQLAALHPIFDARSLTCLHLQIKCSEKLLVYMLGLVPCLEELRMGLSSPHALSSDFFLAFAAGGSSVSTAMIETSSQTIPPLCRELKRLHVHYKRWLRGPERNALIPAFGDVVASHHNMEQTGFSLCLSFDERSSEQVWQVHGLVDGFDLEPEGYDETFIGFSGPHGIVLLSTALRSDSAYFQHFRELEYIIGGGSTLLIDYFFPFHSLREVRMPIIPLEFQPNTSLPTNFSFFHTLKVLDVLSIPSSFLAGQTFHKLEKYGERSQYTRNNPGERSLTEMPVCTSLVVELARLATFKLSQICELSVFIDCEEPNNIWEKHIAVNSNLSGLKLLYFNILFEGRMLPTRPDLIQILRSLPALETLIIDGEYINTPYIDFFKAFVPTGAQETTGLSISQTRGEGQISGLLCPMLESLQIQGIMLTEQPELMPVLKDIVTQHAIIGCPLKSFTFFFTSWSSEYRQKWELIGKDGSFSMEDVVPAYGFYPYI